MGSWVIMFITLSHNGDRLDCKAASASKSKALKRIAGSGQSPLLDTSRSKQTDRSKETGLSSRGGGPGWSYNISSRFALPRAKRVARHHLLHIPYLSAGAPSASHHIHHSILSHFAHGEGGWKGVNYNPAKDSR